MKNWASEFLDLVLETQINFFPSKSSRSFYENGKIWCDSINKHTRSQSTYGKPPGFKNLVGLENKPAQSGEVPLSCSESRSIKVGSAVTTKSPSGIATIARSARIKGWILRRKSDCDLATKRIL